MHPVPPIAAHERFQTGARTIARPRFTAQLDRIIDVGVGLVSAAAGAGKTTLLSSWATELGGPHVAWVTCGEEHNDPSVLAEQIRTALAPAVEVPTNTSLGGVFDTLVRDHGGKIVLILDDAHSLHSHQVLAVVDG